MIAFRTSFVLSGALVAWLMVSATLGRGTAAAQSSASLESGGADLHLFRPAIDSRGNIAVNGTDILGDGDISLGLVLDVGLEILPFDGFVDDNDRLAADAKGTDTLVDQFFTGTLQFNYGLRNIAHFGLQLPVHGVNGQAVEVPGVYNTGSVVGGLDGQGIGDLSLHGKIRILNADRNPIGLAAVLRVQLPTGDDSRFAGEPGVGLWPSVALEWRPWRPLRVSLEVGYRLNTGSGTTLLLNGRTEPCAIARPGDGTCPTSATQAVLTRPGDSVDYGDLITFGAGAGLRLNRSLELVGELYGTQLAGGLGDKGALSMEALGGLKVFVQRNSYLLLAGGAGLPTDGFQQASARAVLGFVFEPSISDRDGDGFKDDVDTCPGEAEDFDGFEDDDGCPDPDNDGDGILDVDDECPETPEDFDGIEDEDGCPEGIEGDRDGDGILDGDDACPDDPEDRDGFEDDDGCPDPDNDGDGILDEDDLCPNQPEDFDGFKDEDGCPDPDNDADQILDVDDQCPLEPETYNNFEDKDGCPDEGDVIIEGSQITILEKIYFETNSAEILPRSFPLLDAVAVTLQHNPQLTFIEIQGHADERGADGYNIELTQARADSVKLALVERGVSQRRLRAVGYGERCPVDPRSTPVAWEKNRRVEFKIVRTEDGPTGVELVCPAGRSLIPRRKAQ